MISFTLDNKDVGMDSSCLIFAHTRETAHIRMTTCEIEPNFVSRAPWTWKCLPQSHQVDRGAEFYRRKLPNTYRYFS